MANFREFLAERVLRLKVQPNTAKSDELPITRPGEGLVDMLNEIPSSDVNTMSDLNSFRQFAQDRQTQYQIFDEMEEDTTISSALEIYADDSTQYNGKGDIIWAESSEDNIAAFANRLITTLRLNENAWSHIYSLCHYGDLYLETFQDGDEDKSDPLYRDTGSNNVNLNKRGIGRLKDYIEQVPNPAEIFDITKHGKTVGFVRVPSQSTKDNTTSAPLSVSTTESVYDPRKFIHICINSNPVRTPETITLEFKNSKKTNVNDNGKVNDKDSNIVKTYNVRRGKSILADIYKIYQEVKLMEDSLLLNRITRSSIIRLMQVEVGDMNKSAVANLLKRLKQMMEQKNIINKTEGTYKSLASPGPIDNILYVPTRNGKGSITANNIGGDVDVKSISDVDYFSNKLYGGLKIPKGFMGQDSTEGSLSAGTSLTKLDSRYARTIKRVQNAYISGITTLINIYAIDKGFSSYVNKFTIKMQSPATTEDAERDDAFGTKIGIIGDIMNALGDTYDEDTKHKILEYLFGTYLGDNDIQKILEEAKKTDTSKNNEDTITSHSSGFSSSSFGNTKSSHAPEESGNGTEEPSTSSAEEAEPESPSLSFSNVRSTEETTPSAPDNGFGNF
jgi:hypothetical protein